jgi:hypothetical protein
VKIKKTSQSFDEYTVDLSWGQLTAIRDALIRSHADPIKDEILNNINWSMDRLPKPGEDKDDKEPKGDERPPTARPGSLTSPLAYGEEDFDLDAVLPPPEEEHEGEEKEAEEVVAGPEKA